jgi:hypothetical protein
MTVLRPHLITFVETGAAALKTPAFRETIKQAFLTHGCFEEICSAQRQDEARIALLAAEGGGVGGAAVVAGAPIIAVPAEEEEELEQEEEVEDDIDGLLESVVNLDARLI